MGLFLSYNIIKYGHIVSSVLKKHQTQMMTLSEDVTFYQYGWSHGSLQDLQISVLCRDVRIKSCKRFYT